MFYNFFKKIFEKGGDNIIIFLKIMKKGEGKKKIKKNH